MVEMKGSSEAEDRAREFIKERHFRLKQILFRTVRKEEDVWLIEGEVSFRRAYFLTTKRFFKLRMKVETGEVVFYEEMRHHST